jgi:hypothetical protein
MDDGPGGMPEPDEEGWFADPDHPGQERFWDGVEWTAEVRSDGTADAARPQFHLPEHTPELQRALAAATADIDTVEQRLSTLFERGEAVQVGDGTITAEAPAWAGRPTGSSSPATRVVEPAAAPEPTEEDLLGDDDPLLEDFDEEPAVYEDDDDVASGASGAADEEDDALADLDEALASEAADEA